MTDTNPAIYKLKRLLLQTTIGLFGLSAALGILFVFSAPDSDAWRILATTTLLAFFSLFSMSNIMRLDSTGYIKTLAGLAMASNLFWTIPGIIIIWGLTGDISGMVGNLWKTIWIFINLSICLTLTGSFMNMKDRSNTLDILRFVAIISAWFLYIYISPAVLASNNSAYIGETWQLIAIVSILFVFSAITVPILNRIKNSKTQNTTESREHLKAELRREIEAEIRQEIEAEQQSGKTNLPSA